MVRQSRTIPSKFKTGHEPPAIEAPSAPAVVVSPAPVILYKAPYGHTTALIGLAIISTFNLVLSVVTAYLVGF